MRLVGVGMVLVFAFVVSLALWEFYLSPSGLPGGDRGLTGILLASAFFITAGTYIATLATAVPHSVEINSDGFALSYPGARVERIMWADPGLRLRFERTEGITRRGLKGPPMAVLMGGRPPRRYLSPAVFNELARQARANGLRVQEEPSPYPGFTRTVISHG